MPKKGHKATEETRLRMSEGAKNRPSRLIGRYGNTKESVEAAYAAGLIWCSTCKSFKTEENFNNVANKVRCKECSAKLYKQHYEKNSEKVNKQRRNYYDANRYSELHKDRYANMSKYEADWDWYNKTLESQGGGCAICGTKEVAVNQTRFHIDHNHNCCTKKKTACDKCRRGLVCGRCNTSLERMEVIPNWAANAVSYLRKYGVELA